MYLLPNFMAGGWRRLGWKLASEWRTGGGGGNKHTAERAFITFLDGSMDRYRRRRRGGP
jgi:hypothetical protein